MGKKSLIKNNKAVAGVIEALLIVALVSIIISTIQLIYVPEIMKQREADHMEEIENQFSFLKAVIDIQSMEKKDVPITSTITLGSKELPYFVTARGFGELFIIGQDDSNFKINIDYGAKIIPLTSIKYEALNSYYVDQIYAIEGGCIILQQNDGETVRVEPTINIQNRSSEINIYYDIDGYNQLMWNRIHEFRGNPSLKEYDEDDIKKMLKKLKLPPDTHFIVGHNPLWNTGDMSGIWLDVLGIKNHHIIYSNLQTLAPYLIFENNKLKKRFAIKPKEEVLYV